MASIFLRKHALVAKVVGSSAKNVDGIRAGHSDYARCGRSLETSVDLKKLPLAVLVDEHVLWRRIDYGGTSDNEGRYGRPAMGLE
jgi:hypothetical protein